jgi:hypothetical protein
MIIIIGCLLLTLGILFFHDAVAEFLDPPLQHAKQFGGKTMHDNK